MERGITRGTFTQRCHVLSHHRLSTHRRRALLSGARDRPGEQAPVQQAQAASQGWPRVQDAGLEQSQQRRHIHSRCPAWPDAHPEERPPFVLGGTAVQEQQGRTPGSQFFWRAFGLCSGRLLSFASRGTTVFLLIFFDAFSSLAFIALVFVSGMCFLSDPFLSN